MLSIKQTEVSAPTPQLNASLPATSITNASKQLALEQNSNNNSMNKTKDRFRRLPQTQTKQNAHSQNVSVLNGQSMDVSSDIYKIYIQDSQAAQNRLEMHKTLSLLQIQQISRTAQKDKDKYQSTRQSPQKGFHSSNLSNMGCQNITQIPTGGVLSQLSLTQGPAQSLASKASSLRKQQNSANQHQHTENVTMMNNNAKIAIASQVLTSKISSGNHTNLRNHVGKTTGLVHDHQSILQMGSSGPQTPSGGNFAALTSATTAQSFEGQNIVGGQLYNPQPGAAISAVDTDSNKNTSLIIAQNNHLSKNQNTSVAVSSAYAVRHNNINTYSTHSHQVTKKKTTQSHGLTPTTNNHGSKAHQYNSTNQAAYNRDKVPFGCPQPTNYEVYQRETVSPSAAMTHQNINSETDAYYHIQQKTHHSHNQHARSNGQQQYTKQSTSAYDKSHEQSFKFTHNGASPSNGKTRKRRAPSGVNKIKLVGDKTIKQAIEVAVIRNEVLSQPTLKNVTPTKGIFDSGSVTNQLDMLIRQEDEKNYRIDSWQLQQDQEGFRAQLVETSKIASANASSTFHNNISESVTQAQLPNSSHTVIGQTQGQTKEYNMMVEGQSSTFETTTNESAREGDHPNVTSSKIGITERDEELSQPSPEAQITAISQNTTKGGRVIDYLKSEEFIVACGSRGTSSQGRITRVQPATSKKNVISNYKKTIREKMLFESDTNHIFDTQNSRVLNTEINVAQKNNTNTQPQYSMQNGNNKSSVVSPLRSYYRQPVSLTKKQIKKQHQNQLQSAPNAKNSRQINGKPPTNINHRQQQLHKVEQMMASTTEMDRAYLMLDHLKELRSRGHTSVTKEQATQIFDAFALFTTPSATADQTLIQLGRLISQQQTTSKLTIGSNQVMTSKETNEVQLSRIIGPLEEYLLRQQQDTSIQEEGSDQLQQKQKNTFTNDQVRTLDLETHKTLVSAVQSSVGTPKHVKLISGAGHQAGHRGQQAQTLTSAGTAAKQPQPNTNNIFSLSNKNQPQIDILIHEEKIHMQHPINKCIRLINQFSIEAFLMQNQAYFLPQQQKNTTTKGSKNGGKAGKSNKFFSSQNYHTFNTTMMSAGNYQQMSPIAANNTCANIDMSVVQSLAKQLQITLPKNGDLRSKAFICHAKEQMLTKLFDTLNKSNAVELNFKRQLFQTYRGFIGRGNNAQLLFQLFKQSRWWWNLYSAPQHDENGKVIMQHGQTSIQLLREDFKEHNFIFTQWKKMMHFSVLKSLKVQQPETLAVQCEEQSNLNNLPSKQNSFSVQPAQSRAMSPNNAAVNRKDIEITPETNTSNQWRIYAKMEANYHLSNKFALFFHMSKYYKSIERDPFDVLPLTFHITKGTTDSVYFKFIAVFRQLEEKYNQELTQMEEGGGTKLQQPEQQEKSLVLICARCTKQGNRSGLGHREQIQPIHSSYIESSELSLPEFVDKSNKFRKQHTLIDTGPSRRTPARGPILSNDRQSSQARKMSLAIKTSSHQTTTATIASKNNGQKQTCCKCGLSVEDNTNSNVLSNAQSLSSLKRRSSLNQGGGEEEEDTAFKFSKGRFSQQKFDQNKQMHSHRNHSTNKRENSIQPQGSLSRLHRRGVQFEEVAVKTTLTNDKQDGGDQKSSMSVADIQNQKGVKACSSFDQSTRLPAIRTGKHQMVATQNLNDSEEKQKTTAAPTMTANQTTSPKMNMSRQSKFQGPLNLQDKIQSTITKTRLKRTPIQEPESQKKHGQKKKEKIIPNNIWIVKPGENSNRGNGIEVCSTLREIKSILCQSDYDKQKTFIVQKYIERPALYNQRKFDIRCFGMLTLVNGRLKGFTYDNGYLRTSSRNFVNDDLSNKLIHLTNDAVQKKSEEYGRFESGNKLTFSEYQHYLDQNFGHLKIDFRSHIFTQIKQIMTDTFRATYKIISPSRTLQHHTFEIFGFDFMLDENFKVYLIEVNTNPCLETSCPLLQKLITDVVDSGMRLALDPLFPPPNQQKRMNTQISVIQWQLSFDEELDAPQIEALQAKVMEGRKLNSAPEENGGADEDQQAVEEDLIQECEDEQEFD